MAFWQTPQVQFVRPENIYSGAAGLFMNSLQAGAQLRKQREQLAADAAAAELERDKFGALLGENAADNARDERRVVVAEKQQTHAEAEAEAKRKETDRLARQKSIEEIYKVAQTDPKTAKFMAENRGISWGEVAALDESNAPPVAPSMPSEAPPAAAPPEAAPSVPVPNPFRPGAPPVMAPERARAKKMLTDAGLGLPEMSLPPPLPTPEGTPPTDAGLTRAAEAATTVPAVPGAPPAAAGPPPDSMRIGGIMGSMTAAADARKALGEREAAIVRAGVQAGTAGMPQAEQQMIQKAAAQAEEVARATGNAEKGFQLLEKRFGMYFGAAQAMDRAHVAASAQRQKAADKPPTDTQQKVEGWLDTMLGEELQLKQLPPMSEAGRQAMFEELAFIDAAHRNPTADALARLGGFRQSLEKRLPPADRQSYAATMAYMDPLVRSRTGAALGGPADVELTIGPMVPRVGDTPADDAAKHQRRRRTVVGLARQTRQPWEWEGPIEQAYGPAIGPQIQHAPYTQPGAKRAPRRPAPAPMAPAPSAAKASSDRADSILGAR